MWGKRDHLCRQKIPRDVRRICVVRKTTRGALQTFLIITIITIIIILIKMCLADFKLARSHASWMAEWLLCWELRARSSRRAAFAQMLWGTFYGWWSSAVVVGVVMGITQALYGLNEYKPFCSSHIIIIGGTGRWIYGIHIYIYRLNIA